MDCAEAKLRIESYAAGNLPAAQKGALEAHLASCAECRLDSELTRASKNPPSGTGSEPDVQGKPAESATPPPGDWTIESIFGSGTNPGSGSLFTSAAAPAATPSPSPSAPANAGKPAEQDVFERGASPVAAPRPETIQAPQRGSSEVGEASEEPAAEGSPGWAFEPADVKEDAKPPEGSLFFAEEALSRTDNGAKGKSSLLRVVLWGVGGLLGVALLGVSVWVAFSLEPPQPTPPGEQQQAGAPEGSALQVGEGTEAGAPETGATESVAQAPEASQPPESPGSPGSPGSDESQPTIQFHVQEPEAPRVAVEAPKPRVAAPAGGAGERTRAVPKTTVATAPPKARPPAASTTPAPATVTRPPAERTRPADDPPAHTLDTESESDRPLWEPAIREEPSVPTSTAVPRASSPAATPPRETAPKPSDETDAPAPPAQRPRSTTPPPRTTPTETASESSEPLGTGDAVQRPIDRLHLATLAAEQNADLVALRKMRDTWRGFLRTSVGPDRARAKREMADCLWAIQTLTTRTSDQKAALAAYRDYVLNAPAGGADARTVSRMRQLEDALAESR